MTRYNAAAAELLSEPQDYDPEATISIAPEAKRRLLEQAFSNADAETTLRMVAPLVAASAPSPLGEPSPVSGDRPTRPNLEQVSVTPGESGMVCKAPTPVLGRPQTLVLAIWSLTVILAGVVAALALRS